MVNQELDNLRREIDIIDNNINDLIDRRFAYCLQIAAVKQNEGLPINDPARQESLEKSYGLSAIAKNENENRAVKSKDDSIVLNSQNQFILDQFKRSYLQLLHDASIAMQKQVKK